MKNILFITILLTVSLVQAQHFNGGIKLGGNYATLYNLNQDIDRYQDFKYKLGYDVGFIFKIHVSKFGAHIEPGLSNRGSRVDNETDYQLNYFTLPVLAAFHPTDRFCLLFGPEFSYLISANEMKKWKISTIEDAKEVFNNEVDFGFNAGFAVLIKEHLGIEARYSFGLLSPVDELYLENEDGSVSGSFKIYNQGLMVNFIYLFGEYKDGLIEGFTE